MSTLLCVLYVLMRYPFPVIRLFEILIRTVSWVLFRSSSFFILHCRNLRIWSYLLKKSLMENSIFVKCWVSSFLDRWSFTTKMEFSTESVRKWCSYWKYIASLYFWVLNTSSNKITIGGTLIMINKDYLSFFFVIIFWD